MKWILYSVLTMTGLFLIRSLNSHWIFDIPFQNEIHRNIDLYLSSNNNRSKEVFCITGCEYLKLSQHPRPGLEMIKYLYEHLAQIKDQYSSPSHELKLLVSMWKTLLSRHGSVKNPWKLASQWASSQSLIDPSGKGLANILSWMRTSDIVHSDSGYKGTQLKISLVLKGGQVVVFKPERAEEPPNVRRGSVYEGADRHYGEIASFHLSLLLNMTTVPLVVGRKVSLRKEVFPVASKKLAKTFLLRGRRTCLYGDCLYCRIGDPVCDDGRFLDGAAILWLDKRLNLTHHRHPWARLYRGDRLAEWETNREFCHKFSSSLSRRDFPLLLNLIDVSVFDFLIQNGDRHHYSVVASDPDSAIFILDNGKGFGDPFKDHLDILAPLLQCCRIRRRTFDRLRMLAGGGLSKALDDLLYTDVLYPVIGRSHLRALDRRIYFVLAAIKFCQRSRGDAVFS